MSSRMLEVVIKARDEMSKTLSSINSKVGDFADNVESKFGKTADAFKGVGAGMTGVGVAGIALIGHLASTAGEVEQLGIAFETMLGSADASKKMITDLTNFAASTPFELAGIQKAAKSLIAFGIESENVIPSLTRIGDVAAGLGVNIDELSYLYGKARVSGVLMAEDVNQFTERGVPIIAELAKQFGIAESEVKELVSTGAVGFDDLEAAFVSMTSEGGKFGGLMEKQSASLLGKWSTLKDSVFQLSVALGTPLIGPLSSLATKVGEVAAKVQEFVQNNPKVAEFAAKVLLIGTAIAAIGGPILLLIGFIPSIVAGFAAITTVTTAFGTALAFVAANPIVWIIAAVVALVAGIVLLIKHWDAVSAKVVEVWDAIFGKIMEVVGPIIESIAGFISSVWQTISSGLEKVKNFFTEAFYFILGVFDFFMQTFLGISLPQFVQFFLTIWTSLVEGAKMLFQSMLDALNLIWELIKWYVTFHFEALKAIFNAAKTILLAVWNAIWDTAVSAISSFADSVKSAVQPVLDWLADKFQWISDIAGKIGNFVSGAVSSISKAGKNVASKISGKKAMGGPVVGGNSYLVGERGPEIFTPYGGGSVTPNNRMASGGGVNVVVNIAKVNDNVDVERMAKEVGKRIMSQLSFNQQY